MPRSMSLSGGSRWSSPARYSCRCRWRCWLAQGRFSALSATLSPTRWPRRCAGDGWRRSCPVPRIVVTTSTAAAAAAVAAGETGPGGLYDAAIAAPVAAQRYGLETLATAIGDHPDAVTRFVLVTRPAPPPPPTGADRTSLVAFIRDDHPGALLEILEQFATRGVNLTRIESRPTGNGMGRYCFAVDCEGHVADARVGEALMGLRRICAEVRFLGSYPRADGVTATPARGTANEDFDSAEAWLASLRG